MSTTVDHFVRYKTRWPHWHFTWSPPGLKGPRYPGWNDPRNAITDLDEGREWFTRHPEFGLGVLLGPSRLVSLDVDVVNFTRDVLATQRIDLDAITHNAPRVIGNPSKFRCVFEAPDDVELHHVTLQWPQQEDPRKAFCLFELRAGLVSDMLPPSRHPQHGSYRWGTPPRVGFPKLPPALRDLGLSWGAAEKDMRAACPWYAPPVPSPPKPRTSCAATSDKGSVIRAFNQARDVTQLLETHGYVKRGKRFASPGTSHSAGLVLLDSGKVYCHHQGDPLNTGRALDCFDLYAHLAHQGDVRAAVKAAAAELGIGR